MGRIAKLIAFRPFYFPAKFVINHHALLGSGGFFMPIFRQAQTQI
jgi:hypothetical protein